MHGEKTFVSAYKKRFFMTLMFGQILRQGSSLFHEQSLFMQKLILQRLLKNQNPCKMGITKEVKEEREKNSVRVL